MKFCSTAKKTSLPGVWFVLAITIALVCGEKTHAQSSPEVIEGAKKEGKVQIYGVLNLTSSRPVFKAFEKKYPFLQVQQYKASSNRMVNRLLTEHRAKTYLVDVIQFNIVEQLLLLEAGIGAPYHSPERKHFPSAFKDKEGFWTAIYYFAYTIGYNPQMVPSSDVPRTWEDLLHSRWRDNIGLEDYAVNWYGNMLLALGDEKGRSFMTRLSKQNPRIVDGPSLMAQLMAAGEFPIGVARSHRMEIFKQNGAPLEWVRNIDPMVQQSSVIGLANHAPHPNAAKLLIDFMLSEEAQESLSKQNRMVARRGVKMVKAYQEVDLERLLPPSPWVISNLDKLTKEYTSLFHGK